MSQAGINETFLSTGVCGLNLVLGLGAFHSGLGLNVPIVPGWSWSVGRRRSKQIKKEIGRGRDVFGTR